MRPLQSKTVVQGSFVRDKVLLVLIEKPSFEGELTVRLIEEYLDKSSVRFRIECEKKPPLNQKEFPIFLAGIEMHGQELDELTRSIVWQQEVPSAEVAKVKAILERQIFTIVPETVIGLDGTNYELVIERGFNKIQFNWWSNLPATWQALGSVCETLLKSADATSMVERLQSNHRRRLIQNLQEELEDARRTLEVARAQSIQTHNKRCLELAEGSRGLACPFCRAHLSDIRFIDKGPLSKSYFICGACGRSFRPGDVEEVEK